MTSTVPRPGAPGTRDGKLRRRAIRVAMLTGIAIAGAAWARGDAPRGREGPTLEWWTVDAGGGASTGGTLTLTGSIGQPDAGIASGGDIELVGGFWASPPSVTPCPADIDGNGVVDVGDLLAVLAAWDQAGGPADVTGDGIVDVADLLAVLAAWGIC